jgi:hypothetical protein
MPQTRRDFLPTGLRVFLLVEGVAMLVLVGVLLAVDDEVGPVTLVVAIVLIVALQVGLFFMHGFITVRQETVRVGFWPLYWRTFRYCEIASVEAIQVDAMRDYRGWGLKGRSRGEKGMLLGGGSPHGASLVLHDGRRYVVTSRGPVDDLVATMAQRVR